MGRFLNLYRAAVLSALLSAPATGVLAQTIKKVEPTPLPAGKDMFDLSLDEMRKYSDIDGFEILGHSYLKVDGRTDWAKGKGRAGPEVGGGFNTVRVHDGIAYLAGYNSPPTVFGIVIADVHDPANIKPLGFIPCNPGTRCTYLRLNAEKKVLIFGNDESAANPTRVKAGEKAQTGWSFYDVSNPAKPKKLGFVAAAPGAPTHGMDADDRYVYGCGAYEPDMEREGLQIIDYADPAHPKQVAAWHVPGQRPGEQAAPLDSLNVDGKPQVLQCHEIVVYNDRLYLAWRDAGIKVLDIKDRTKPQLIATYDYTPPYYGGVLGSAHTAMPVVVKQGQQPNLLLSTDEIFECPAGFGRILDISDMNNPDVLSGKRPSNIQLLTTFRAPHAQDNFDYQNGKFVCPPQGSGVGMGISETTHLPVQDLRAPSLVYVTWYNEGLRAFDITNPYLPKEIGHYVSPPFAAPAGGERAPGRPMGPYAGRFTREIYQDPATKLLYVTDGGGGGLTILRYTGDLPKNPPLPGAR